MHCRNVFLHKIIIFHLSVKNAHSMFCYIFSCTVIRYFYLQSSYFTSVLRMHIDWAKWCRSMTLPSLLYRAARTELEDICRKENSKLSLMFFALMFTWELYLEGIVCPSMVEVMTETGNYLRDTQRLHNKAKLLKLVERDHHCHPCCHCLHLHLHPPRPPPHHHHLTRAKASRSEMTPAWTRLRCCHHLHH